MFRILPVIVRLNKTRFSFRLPKGHSRRLLWMLLCHVALLSGAGCRSGKETPPIPAQTMERVLVDIHLAEIYSQGLGDSVKNRFEKNYDSLGGFYVSILKHYNLSFEEFNDALDWYRERPGTIDSLYARVLTRFNELKASKGIADGPGQPATDTATRPAIPPPDTAARNTDIDQPKKFDTTRTKPVSNP